MCMDLVSTMRELIAGEGPGEYESHPPRHWSDFFLRSAVPFRRRVIWSVLSWLCSWHSL